MIIAGLTGPVGVVGSVETTITLNMEQQTTSDGVIRWFDLGAVYDNIEIKLSISSFVMWELESVFRSRQGDTIAVTFGYGEWLYPCTNEFTILKSSDYRNIGGNDGEYVVDLTLSAHKMNIVGLGGNRAGVESAYIEIAGVKIPQPKKYNYNYATVSNAYNTNGTAYSEGLTASNMDTTSFTVECSNDNVRAFIDALYLYRGSEFNAKFPKNSFPFGVARGGLEHTYRVVLLNNTIEVTNRGGADECSIKIGVAVQ